MTLRILAENLHDTANLTVTSEAMPVSYTQRSERPLVWRSEDLQTQVLEATLPTGGLIDCVALARHNLGGVGVIKVEILSGNEVVHSSGDVSTALLIPAGLWQAGIDSWGASYNDRMPGNSALGIYWLPAPKVADGYRLTISSGVTSGYIEIGRIFVGMSFSPAVNMNWGCTVEWQENAQHIATEGGSLRTVGAGDLRRKFSFQLDWLDETDRQKLITQLVKVGPESDLLVALYPESGGLKELEHTMICRRDGALSHTHSHFNNWKASLAFTEV